MGGKTRSIRFMCEMGTYPLYSLTAALVCETGQTWGSQHFLNPLHFFIISQDIILTMLLGALNEGLEVLIRRWVAGPWGKSGDADSLASYETPVGSLVYDWMIQNWWAIAVGILWVITMGTGIRRRSILTCRAWGALAIFFATVLLQILAAQLEPKNHVAAVILVGVTAALGGSLNLWYMSSSSSKPKKRSQQKRLRPESPERFGPPRAASLSPYSGEINDDKRRSAAAAEEVSEADTPVPIGFQIVAYVLIVATVMLGGAPTDPQTNYMYLFGSQGIVTVILFVTACMVGRCSSMSLWIRNGCATDPALE